MNDIIKIIRKDNPFWWKWQMELNLESKQSNRDILIFYQMCYYGIRNINSPPLKKYPFLKRDYFWTWLEKNFPE